MTTRSSSFSNILDDSCIDLLISGLLHFIRFRGVPGTWDVLLLIEAFSFRIGIDIISISK